MAKKSREQRKRAREERYRMVFETMHTAITTNPSFDTEKFIASLPSEFRGLGCLAEREIYKELNIKERRKA